VGHEIWQFFLAIWHSIPEALARLEAASGDLIQAGSAIAGISAGVYAILVQFRDTAPSRDFPTEFDRARHIRRLDRALRRIVWSLRLGLGSLVLLLVVLLLPSCCLSSLLALLGTIAFALGLIQLVSTAGSPFRRNE
jgi:hypothetical protein